MNKQNAADKDLLTIEELAAHAMECEKEEAATTASLADVEAEGAPSEKDSHNEPGSEKEETGKNETAKTQMKKNKPREKTAKDGREKDGESTSLVKQLRDFVNEDEAQPFRWYPFFKSIIGGDGLSHFFVRNWLFITVLVFFSCCYVTSRYMMQNATLERNTLSRTLADRKYKALTASSEYLEKTRSHYIESNLKDTTIRSSTDMPFSLKIDSKNSNE